MHSVTLYIVTLLCNCVVASDREAILNDLRVDLALKFEFLFSPTHVEMISGKQEGIYSWIAINHALGRFDHSSYPGVFYCFSRYNVSVLCSQMLLGLCDLSMFGIFCN